jgi:transposase InsO family protein
MAGVEVDVNVKLAVVLARRAAFAETTGRLPKALKIAPLCRQLGISRPSFYEWEERFAREGVAGLLPRSRRPHSNPNRTPTVVEDAIVRARKELEDEGWDNGAASIAYRLRQWQITPPSTATINRVLARRGQVSPQPQKRPKSSWKRFESAERNGRWQMDAFEWPLADGRKVVVFETLDDCTRLLLDSTAAPAETAEAALASFLAAVDRYGPPETLLTDNGTAFNGERRGWTRGMLVDAARALGVHPITSRPGHPQTNGKNERHHQTCQRWLRHQPPASSLAELQIQLDTYRRLYNTVRPHQALDGKTPAEAAETAPLAAPASPTPAAEPTPVVRTRPVHRNGVAALDDYLIYVGHRHVGKQVTLIRTGDHVAVLHGQTLLRELTLDTSRRYQNSSRAITTGQAPAHQQVSTMS